MRHDGKQNPGKTYAQLIKFGRLLKNHHETQAMCDEQPELILAFVDSIDKQLLWTSTDDFFSIFPPIKRYADEDDCVWDYHSTMDMRNNEFGDRFGKDDFKELLMNRCYENKYLQLVGFAFMLSISRQYKKRTRTSMVDKLLNEIM